MRQFWNLILMRPLIMLLLVTYSVAQRSFYRRSYYSSVAPAAPRYSRTSQLQPLPSFRSDLQSEESKRRDVTKKYAKKQSYKPYASDEDDFSSERYTSGEHSIESQSPYGNSHETDSHEYTIGTQIRVQHPITVPKKSTTSYPKHTKYINSSPYKSISDSYSIDPNLSTEERVPEHTPPTQPKRSHAHKYTQIYDSPDPFHLVPPPKSTVTASSSNSYSVYEPEVDEIYEVQQLHSPKSGGRSSNYDRYKGVASKKQIEAYIIDQKKLLDDALKLQLLNDPKIQKYLKSKLKESQTPEGLELEDFESYPPIAVSPFRSNNFGDNPPPSTFKANRSRRRPPTEPLKHSPKPKLIAKPKRKYRSTALVINV